MVTDKGLQKDPVLGKKIDKAVFPGLQGGPHLHTIAGIGVALKEAGQASFKDYAKQTVLNAKTLASKLTEDGFDLITGGTDNHLLLMDLRKYGIGGKEAAEGLEESNIVVNKNAIPGDEGSPTRPAGIRLGTPAVTTRGMKEEEMEQIAELIKEVLIKGKNVKIEVEDLCRRFPV